MALDILMMVLLLVVILSLVFSVLIPALIDALRMLLVSVVYLTVIFAAFAITIFVFVATWVEPDELPIEQLSDDAVLYLDTMSFWIWTRWT